LFTWRSLSFLTISAGVKDCLPGVLSPSGPSPLGLMVHRSMFAGARCALVDLGPSLCSPSSCTLHAGFGTKQKYGIPKIIEFVVNIMQVVEINRVLHLN